MSLNWFAFTSAHRIIFDCSLKEHYILKMHDNFLGAEFSVTSYLLRNLKLQKSNGLEITINYTK